MVCGVVPDSSNPGLVWPMALHQFVLLEVLDALRNADAALKAPRQARCLVNP
jgi:hypothetical protein